MEKGTITEYFLGANSRHGFYSLYDSFFDPEGGDFLWVIKGGPGCGKSSFMKKIAAAMSDAGYDTELIRCSGDPDSLDGLYIPALRVGYVDGTSPHVVEAVYPGAASLYLDLGACYDASALEKKLSGISELNRRYKGLYAEAYGLIASSSQLFPGADPSIWGEAARQRLEKRACGAASRLFRNADARGSVKRCFLGALTCRGRVFESSTVKKLCSRVYLVDNGLGMADSYLRFIYEKSVSAGCGVILAPDPVAPERLQALLFPDIGTGFIASDAGFDGAPSRCVHIDALADKAAVAAGRAERKKRLKLSLDAELLAVEKLSEAKRLHDELEKIYNPCVDFPAVYAVADDHIAWLLSAGSAG